MVPVEVVTLFGATPGTVFAVELDTEVHAASMSASGERATTSSGGADLGPGDEGPFRRMRHEHVFEQVDETSPG